MKGELLTAFSLMAMALAIVSAALLFVEALQVGLAAPMAIAFAWLDSVVSLFAAFVYPIVAGVVLILNKVLSLNLKLEPHWKHVLFVSTGCVSGALRALAVVARESTSREMQWSSVVRFVRYAAAPAGIAALVLFYGTQPIERYERAFIGEISEYDPLVWLLTQMLGLSGVPFVLCAAGLLLLMPLAICSIFRWLWRRQIGDDSKRILEIWVKASASLAAVPIGVILLMLTNAGLRLVPGL